MASKYVTENSGSGFALPADDDDELQKLFQFESEDDTEEDTSRFFEDPNAGLDDVEQEYHEVPVAEESSFDMDENNAFDVIEEHVPHQDNILQDEYDDTSYEIEEPVIAAPEVYDEPVQQTYQAEIPEEPEYAPEPVLETPPAVESRWATNDYVPPTPVEEPIQEEATPIADEYASRRSRRSVEPETLSPAYHTEDTTVSQHSTKRLNIPSEADRIQEVDRIIRVLDVYRNLGSPEIKNSVYALMTLDNEEPESVAQVVVKAMHADQLLFETIRALREAKNTGPVERVFYILELPDEVFYNLGDMAIVFTDDDPIDRNQTKTSYARKLVPIIESLEENVMAVVSAAEKTLEAAFDEHDTE